METLRGIFPRTQPPPKRDFLRENVMRIKSMQNQRMRKSKDSTEYSTKFNKQYQPRKLSLSENSSNHRSTNSLQLCSSKAPINCLRKGVSSMSLQPSREIGVQTIDPESDQYFLKDSIIRYPSASTTRSTSASQQTTNTCSRGHILEDTRPKYRSSRRDEDRIEKYPSNLSDYYDNKTPVSKKPTSILKSSSSIQKLHKDSFNESQQKVDRCKSGGSSRVRTEEIVISDEDDNNYAEKSNKEEGEKEHRKRELKVQLEKEKEDEAAAQKRKQQLKLAAEDPKCPEGMVPVEEEERLSMLKLAQKQYKDLVDQWNKLPMTCETLRVRNRKIEIEKELKELDKTIRTFSSKRVYVNINE